MDEHEGIATEIDATLHSILRSRFGSKQKSRPKEEPKNGTIVYGIWDMLYIYIYVYIYSLALSPPRSAVGSKKRNTSTATLPACSLSLSLWLKGSSQQLNAVGFQHLGLGVAHSWPTGLQNRNSVLEPWAPSAGTLGAVRVKVGAQSGTLGAVR